MHYLVLLDDSVLVVGGWGVPGDADGGAVLAAHRQHRHLLRRRTGGCTHTHIHTHTHFVTYSR